jgi:hypothetical protein
MARLHAHNLAQQELISKQTQLTQQQEQASLQAMNDLRTQYQADLAAERLKHQVVTDQLQEQNVQLSQHTSYLVSQTQELSTSNVELRQTIETLEVQQSEKATVRTQTTTKHPHISPRRRSRHGSVTSSRVSLRSMGVEEVQEMISQSIMDTVPKLMTSQLDTFMNKIQTLMQPQTLLTPAAVPANPPLPAPTQSIQSVQPGASISGAQDTTAIPSISNQPSQQSLNKTLLTPSHIQNSSPSVTKGKHTATTQLSTVIEGNESPITSSSPHPTNSLKASHPTSKSKTHNSPNKTLRAVPSTKAKGVVHDTTKTPLTQYKPKPNQSFPTQTTQPAKLANPIPAIKAQPIKPTVQSLAMLPQSNGTQAWVAQEAVPNKSAIPASCKAPSLGYEDLHYASSLQTHMTEEPPPLTLPQSEALNATLIKHGLQPHSPPPQPKQQTSSHHSFHPPPFTNISYPLDAPVQSASKNKKPVTKPNKHSKPVKQESTPPPSHPESSSSSGSGTSLTTHNTPKQSKPSKKQSSNPPTTQTSTPSDKHPKTGRDKNTPPSSSSPSSPSKISTSSKHKKGKDTSHLLAAALYKMADKPKPPFKMNYHCQLPNVRMAKGTMTTSSVVIKTFATAKTVEAAAVLAQSRKPVTQEDWDIYFKFHLTHMEHTLRDEMLEKLQVTPVQDSKSFWTMVLRVVIPLHISIQVCEQALDEYMPWHEPIGITRWVAILNALMGHLTLLQHKMGKERDLLIAETWYRHLHKVVQRCPLKEYRELKAVFNSFKLPITKAMEQGTVITCDMYEDVSAQFTKYLVEQWDEFSCQDLFGHKLVKGEIGPTPTPPKTSQTPRVQTPAPTPASPTPSVKAPVTPAPPSYGQVVVEGGAGPAPIAMIRAFTPRPGSAVSCRQSHPIKDPPAHLAKVAPTGIPRTWGWPQYTLPEDPSKPRWPCSYPPPPENQNPKNEYYGDWLDSLNLCSYCLSDKHKRAQCVTYDVNMAKGIARNKERAALAAAQQTGPSQPAQVQNPATATTSAAPQQGN